MANDTAHPLLAPLPHFPAPGRPYLKLTEAAARSGVTRKVMLARLKRNPDWGWADIATQRTRWYVYRDVVPGAPVQDLPEIATLEERIERLSSTLTDLRTRAAETEVADLRSRALRAEASNTLLIEALELQEAANQRLRQALTLHTTPGHVGDLGAGIGSSASGSSSADG